MHQEDVAPRRRPTLDGPEAGLLIGADGAPIGRVGIGRDGVFSGKGGRFRRDVGPVGLLFASLGSIIGSGGNYALAAARALIDVEGLDAEAIARKAMNIAADICVYTNHNLAVEKL